MPAAQHGSITKQGTNIVGQGQQHKGQDGRDNNTSRKAVRCPKWKRLHEGCTNGVKIFNTIVEEDR